MTNLRLLYVTTKDIDQARAISKALLEKKLVACTNILPQMESHYRWKGSIETSHECILILKTRAELVPEVTRQIENLHTYETPCVLELDIAGGAPAYLNWLVSETEG